MRPALLSLVAFSFPATAQTMLYLHFAQHQLKAFHLYISFSTFSKKIFLSRLITNCVTKYNGTHSFLKRYLIQKGNSLPVL